jgi:ribose 5-phosphate isomerase B
MIMKIAIGSDHAGYEGVIPFKPELVKHLESLGHDVLDCGTAGPEPVDYPDYAQKVSEAVLRGAADYGVLMCGTGIGMSIAANRNRGIRAAACASAEAARLAREHNDANVLCLGRRILSLKTCIELLDVFLNTPFSEGERHKRRVAKMG